MPRTIEVEPSGRGLRVGIAVARFNQAVKFTFVGGGEGVMTRGEILQHLVNHTSYHRGFVAQMMCDAGARPPTTDLTVFLRDLRQ